MLAISLRAWPAPDTTKDELPILISRINQQVGSFRNISEGKLEEQIRAGDAEEANLEDSDKVSPSEESEVKSRKEEVLAAQVEILKEVTHAYNESSHALDFVSLLLSKTNPRQAEITMSPFLKDNLPMGCLGAEVVQAPEKSQAEIKQMEMVSVGWKMQSLKSTADSLLRSATRLEQEIWRETKYWEQILAVKEQGWSLCRLPREKHTLGVRYGFAEAHSDFRDRGLAALRRDENGNVELDRGVLSKDRVLRIRILDHEKPTSAHGKVTEQASDSVPVETLILNARNSIFDEELHYELHREARKYANQGIRCIGDKILLPYKNEKQIEIDLVSSSDGRPSSSSEDLVSNIIAMSLRILLLHAHRQNLRRRSKPPPQITESETPRPIYSILKPIVEALQHRSTLQLLQAFFNRLTRTLSAAGLNLSIEKPTSPYKLTSSIPSVPTTEALINTLAVPLRSSFTMHLPSNLTSVKLETITSFQLPNSGTQFQSSILSSPPSSIISTMPRTILTSSLPYIKDTFLHLVKLDIVQLLASSELGADNWKINSAHEGQVRRISDGVHDRMDLDLGEECLSLDWSKYSKGVISQGRRTWGYSSCEEAQGLLDAIEDIFRSGI